jgi:uncharacterized membrane-anchored protein YhcB (DUF1043 family)
MSGEEATILGLFALVIGAAIKEFFSWLSRKNIQNTEDRLRNIEEALREVSKNASNNSNKLETKLDKLLKESQEMYEWHSKSDQDGVKVWYVRQSLENALRDNAKATEAIAKNIELQTRLLEEMIQNQRSMSKEQVEIAKDLRDLERLITEK